MLAILPFTKFRMGGHPKIMIQPQFFEGFFFQELIMISSIKSDLTVKREKKREKR